MLRLENIYVYITQAKYSTQKESALLKLLVDRRGLVVSRDEILNVVSQLSCRDTTAAPSAATIALSNQKVVTLNNTIAWQLFNMGAPCGPACPRNRP